jgi:LacI family gluconate utilization system Gnt-I transcriptional repressor
VLSVTGYQRDLEARLVASLLAWRPAALVVTGLEHDAETLAMLRAAGVTVVEVMDIDGPSVDIAVGMSHAQAGRETAVHLLRRGYRRFGYVGHDIDLDLRARKRRAAFLATLAEGGGQLLGESVAAEASSVAAGRVGLAELLRRFPQIEAVYFSNDDMAIGGIFHCLAEGVAVPGRVAIIGFNGLALGQQLPQPLTTLRTFRSRMGRLAGEAILARLDGKTVETIVDVGFELLPGATA